VWCFVKLKPYQQPWEHLYLSNQEVHTSADTNLLNIQAVNDKNGVLIKRNETGTGSIPNTKITVRLDQPMTHEYYRLWVYGIEMVHIPADSFYLGDTISGVGRSINTFTNGDQDTPYLVTHKGKIPVGTDSSNQLYNVGDYSPFSDIPTNYPNGYNGFYCMKYEISQQQYADFLNTLTYHQQETRTETAPDNSPGTLALTTGGKRRNGIVIKKSGTTSDQPAVYACNANQDNTYNSGKDGHTWACNYLKWADIAAYLDWAGLRPMTELEFEKTARGPNYPVAKEFAWSTANAKAGLSVIHDSTAKETVTEGARADSGIANFRWATFGDEVKGPFRCGFNADSNSSRLTSGSSYYGVMELSGNLWETCVTVDSVGLLFNGKHGNGQLDANGNANVPSWSQTDGTGAGIRGGAWNSAAYFQNFRDLAISDRFYAGDKPDQRRNTTGGRGVRSVK
jgi:formylglycine-generating enzyme required for sulfatase activity